MQRAMVFIDFENFDIAKRTYYKKILGSGCTYPKIDFNTFPRELVKLLLQEHILIKTFLFAPKPDDFLMQDKTRQSTYNWISGMKNYDYITVIEGSHSARPVPGCEYSDRNINDQKTYYVEEKGTDINLAVHLITKGFLHAYDTAIIISGDTDYIPALDVLNTIGKTVIIVGIQGQSLFKFKHHSDAQITLDDEFFKKCLRQN